MSKVNSYILYSKVWSNRFIYLGSNQQVSYNKFKDDSLNLEDLKQEQHVDGSFYNDVTFGNSKIPISQMKNVMSSGSVFPSVKQLRSNIGNKFEESKDEIA